ncbi:rod shape-determining protein MreC [Treponema zioleckii]|uniref:rod shape-determining protein MreC n=1 Tax=Treponema zioleckii TaxID=331680 RepID=UPI00168AEB3A|nr:rod shape-determining protein MreC [Treponema zioleckii]
MKRLKNPPKIHLPELVFIILIFVSGVMLAFNSGGFVLNFEKVGFSILSTMQRGVYSVKHKVETTFNAVHELARLKEENKELAEKMRNYEFLQRSNAEIRKENERLKEQLDFSYAIEQKNYPAQIIGRNVDNLYSYFTINKGLKNGIKKNMPVVAIQHGSVGLVGKIVSVSPFTSRIMPIYDIKSSISSRIQNTRDLGLVNGLGNEESGLSLTYIKKKAVADFAIGDVVVTSGENENYMKDIPIGTISKMEDLPYDSDLVIELVPIIDFSRLETVIVTDMKEVNDKRFGE